MSIQSSPLAEKIDALEYKLKIENEKEKEKDKGSKEFNGSLDAPRPGSGRRPKLCKYLTVYLEFYCNVFIFF